MKGFKSLCGSYGLLYIVSLTVKATFTVPLYWMSLSVNHFEQVRLQNESVQLKRLDDLDLREREENPISRLIYSWITDNEHISELLEDMM